MNIRGLRPHRPLDAERREAVRAELYAVLAEDWTTSPVVWAQANGYDPTLAQHLARDWWTVDYPHEVNR